MEKDQLKQAVRHLAFDVYHFRCYRRLHHEGRLSACAPAVSQAVRYSLLLHVRVLLNFFTGPPRKDDCWVGHFKEFAGIEVAHKSGTLTPTRGAKNWLCS